MRGPRKSRLAAAAGPPARLPASKTAAYLGGARVTLSCVTGRFSPRVDEVGVASDTIALGLRDRAGQRAVLPWWVRSAEGGFLQWASMSFEIGHVRVLREAAAERTVIQLACPGPPLQALLAELGEVPAPLRGLVEAGASVEDRLVLRDFALEKGLLALARALQGDEDGATR